MIDYRGKTVWITGASSGVGEALAHAFAARGARLLLSARREDRLREVARACGTEVALLPLDLAELDRLPGLAARAVERMGPIDVMVHNAGIGQRSSVLDTAFAVDRRMMDTNYLGPVAITKALLPSMAARGHGTFVVVSSVLGLFSVKNRSAYCASKHALHGFFNALRAELATSDIRVLTVCPGHVNTEFSLHALEGDGSAHGVLDDGQKNGITPESCAARILSALDAGRDEIYVAKWENAGVYLNRLAPGLLRRALARARPR